MSPKTSNINIYDLAFGSDTAIEDKETQTSLISINLMSSDQSPSKPPPKATDTKCKDENIKVFEFCELVKDPQDDTVSIVKETFTEEVLPNPDGFGKPLHNRYKYCREVIQPYCKAHTTACPKYPTHREIPFKKSLSNTSKDSKLASNESGSGIVIMSPDEKKTFENPSSSSIKGGKKRPCPLPLPRDERKDCQKEATNCEPYSKCPQYKDEAKLKEYLSSCLSTTVTMAKKASASCLEKCEKTIGVKPPKCGEEKPTYYVLKKPKSKENISDDKYGNILDSEIVQNITSGVKSIVGTVISKTKETAGMITGSNGSCKTIQQEKERRTKECDNKTLSSVVDILPNVFKSQEDNSNQNQNSSATNLRRVLTNTFKTQDDKKSSSLTETNILPNLSKNQDHASIKTSLTNLTSILTNRFKKQDANNEDESLIKIKSILSNTSTSENKDDSDMKNSSSLDKIIEPTVAAIARVASALSSTASTTLDTAKATTGNTLEKLKGLSMADIINSRLESSSPEDDPNISRGTPPRNVNLEYEPEPVENPSVFTMLKTKLYSMFADNREETEDDSDQDEKNTLDQ